MTKVPGRPPFAVAEARLVPSVFAVALVVYAVGLPLGLGRVASAGSVAAAQTLGAGDVEGAPLALLVARLFALLPVGDAATRANLAAATLAAAAIAVLARLAYELLVALRPAAVSLPPHSAALHELLAAGGAALVAGLAPATFFAATVAGAANATLLVVGLGLWGALRLGRDPGQRRVGLPLCLLAGLAAGAGPLAAAVVWPLALLLGLWALRQGERWPVLGPLAFAAGLAVALHPVAARGGLPTCGALVGRLFGGPLSLGGALPLPEGVALLGPGVVEAAEQLGVVAVLLGVVGLVALLAQRPLLGGLAALPLVVSGLAALSPNGTRGSALPLLLAAAVVPIAVGVAFLSRRLAAMRTPAAAVLAVTSLVAPLLDGGATRWRRDARAPLLLLEAAHARSAPRAAVDPGSPELRGLLEYGAAIGLRPDLALLPAR